MKNRGFNPVPKNEVFYRTKWKALADVKCSQNGDRSPPWDRTCGKMRKSMLVTSISPVVHILFLQKMSFAKGC